MRHFYKHFDVTNLTCSHRTMLTNRQQHADAAISALGDRIGMHLCGELPKEEDQKLLTQPGRPPHLSPRRFSTTASTASGEVRSQQSRHFLRLPLQEVEPVAEGLLRLAIEAKGAACREHATDEPCLQRDLLHATRGVAGDAHAAVNISQQGCLNDRVLSGD